MNAVTLSELEQAGIVATLAGGKLRLSAPPGRLTADLRARLLCEKTALVALLSARARLLTLAKADGLPAVLVIGMNAEDMTAWAWFANQPDGTDDRLRACLRTLAKGMSMEGGA